MIFKEIEGQGIVIRRARMVEALHLAQAVQASLPELSRYLSWAGPDYDLAAARQFLSFAREEEDQDLGLHLSVFDSETGELIGGVGLSLRPVFQSAELGYWMRTDCSGRGYTTQAAALMTDYAFRALKLRRVYLVCEVKNPGSRRIAEKLGMRREGRMKEFLVSLNKPRDCFLYAILAREFKPAH